MQINLNTKNSDKTTVAVGWVKERVIIVTGVTPYRDINNIQKIYHDKYKHNFSEAVNIKDNYGNYPYWDYRGVIIIVKQTAQ